MNKSRVVVLEILLFVIVAYILQKQMIKSMIAYACKWLWEFIGKGLHVCIGFIYDLFGCNKDELGFLLSGKFITPHGVWLTLVGILAVITLFGIIDVFKGNTGSRKNNN